MVAMLRWGLLLVALVAASAFAGCGGDEKQPAVLVAIAAPPPDPASPGIPLRVFDAVTGKARLETEPGVWGLPAFSPDGKRLFAISIPTGRGDELDLHFIEVASGKDDVVRVPLGDMAGSAWSPDGSRFAYSGRGGLVVTDERGRQVGEAVPAGAPASDGLYRGRTVWTQDSGLVASQMNGEILLATRDGRAAGKLAPGDLPGAQPEHRIGLMGWLGDGRLAAVRGSTARWGVQEYFSAGVRGGIRSAAVLAPEEMSTILAENSPARGEDYVEAEKLAPGGQVAISRRTADGAGRVLEVEAADGSPPGFRPKLVVVTPKGSFLIDPGIREGWSLRNTYSVVITK